MPGVYVSYPFCNQKCTFCNFASGVAKENRQSLYENLLLEEMRGHRWDWSPDSVYFGGGTPSLLSQSVLRQLLDTIPSENLAEVTLECAPGTITKERIAAWVRCGVNRVSLGVQSFDVRELRHSGRRHTAEIVESDVGLLRSGGITDINLDLIAGLPYQTSQSWANSLQWIERLAPSHVSVYIFEVDEDSNLGKEILAGGKRYSATFVPEGDAAAGFYEEAMERLSGLGYVRYEISNFAQPGFESRHNLKYWRREPYIGFGLDAHSFDGQFRWGNTDVLEDYLRSSIGPERSQRERVDAGEEHFFVGLRLMRGIEPSPEEWSRFASPIQKWIDQGMLEQRAGVLRLSSKGVLVSNEVFQEFLNV